ncbi:MAG: FHA domain-containing protein, partial [Pyrinomonadaceae bacterium]
GEQIAGESVAEESVKVSITYRYSIGADAIEKKITANQGERLSVGRTKENNIAIDDPSLSKYHASLMLDRDGNLKLADTGSTNGTFVNGERIEYGKAMAITERDKVRFGLIDVTFSIPRKPVTPKTAAELSKTEKFSVGEFEFTTRTEIISPAAIAASTPKDVPNSNAAPTIPAIPKDEIPKEDSEPIAPQPQLTSDSIELDKNDIEIP